MSARPSLESSLATGFFYSLFLFVFFLSSCTAPAIYAPVSDASIEPIPVSGTYTVKRGDTLYSIAWRYGLDPYAIAKRNLLSPPYAIYPSQLLYLKGKRKQIANLNKSPPPKLSIPRTPVTAWRWPARGPLLNGFSEQNKGLNMGGKEGDPIVAAASGQVVYSGNGLRGYGNLIIIAHNLSYMSAYAYNRKVYVKEGQWVNLGQRIGEMGKNNAQKTLLHFEIRRLGQPVNPLHYLSRPSGIM